MLFTAVRINKVLQNGIKSYGSQINKIWGVFASTKKAGIRINYFSIKGSYAFKGRFFK